MSLPSLLDEIDRLFDQLVHDPWRYPAGRRPRPQRAPEPLQEVEVEIPVPGPRPRDLSIAVEGARLTVTLHRRQVQAASTEAAEVRASQEERFQETFLLPPGATVSAIEARFDGEVLRVRVALVRS